MLPNNLNTSSSSSPEVADELVWLLNRLGFDAVVRDPQSVDIVASSPGAEVVLLASEPSEVRVATGRLAGVPLRVELVRSRSDDVDLTPRQMEVANLLKEGMANLEIAKALGISSHTVRRHLEQMFRRLAVRNRAGAVAVIKNMDPHTKPRVKPKR